MNRPTFLLIALAVILVGPPLLADSFYIDTRDTEASVRMKVRQLANEKLGPGFLLAVARDEMNVVLREVIADYDERIVAVTTLAQSLQETLQEMESVHTRPLEFTVPAFENVERAQQASE